VIECGSLEYAQARLNARHGERLDEADWRRIEGVRSFAPLLELARSTPLRSWLVGITPESTEHQVESTLRGHWRATVDEVMGWMPARWQAAVAWCAVLPDLAPLQHLARGHAPPPWMSDDSLWRELCHASLHDRRAALDGGPLATLAPAWLAPQTFGEAWLAEWHRRCPHTPAEARDTLGLVVRTLTDHRRDFARAADGQGWLLRQALRARLALLLRRATLEPAAAFIHLALSALDLERLGAELLRRVAFPRWKVA